MTECVYQTTGWDAFIAVGVTALCLAFLFGLLWLVTK